MCEAPSADRESSVCPGSHIRWFSPNGHLIGPIEMFTDSNFWRQLFINHRQNGDGSSTRSFQSSLNCRGTSLWSISPSPVVEISGKKREHEKLEKYQRAEGRVIYHVPEALISRLLFRHCLRHHLCDKSSGEACLMRPRVLSVDKNPTW